MIETLSTVLVGLAFVFVLFNLLAAACFQVFPNRLVTPAERRRFSYLARFEGELAPYVTKWFGLDPGDQDAFFAEYARHELNIYEHEPFCEFRHPQRNGRFINYAQYGYRHNRVQAPWPPEDSTFNVFFFGGSTTLAVGPDWTTIPSKLQDLLNNAAPERPIHVYNFGRGSFFTSMEVTLLQNLLREGRRCDLVIFLDGINDSFFYHGLPPTHGLFQQAISDMNQEVAAEGRARLRSRPKWHLLTKFLATLPLMRLIDVASDMLTSGTRNTPLASGPYQPLTDDQAAAIVARYETNLEIARAICDRHSIPVLFVWQPTPSYGYDLSRHVALAAHFGLQGHERSGEITRLLANRCDLRERADFLWLADLQKGKAEPLYVDTVHYTAAFCAEIAEHLVEGLYARTLVPVPAPGAATDV